MGMDAIYRVLYGYPIKLFPTICKDFEEDFDKTYQKLAECGDFLIKPYSHDIDLINVFVGFDLFSFDWDCGIEEYEVVEAPKKFSLYFLIQNAPEEYKNEVRKVIEDNEPKLYHYCNFW